MSIQGKFIEKEDGWSPGAGRERAGVCRSCVTWGLRETRRSGPLLVSFLGEPTSSQNSGAGPQGRNASDRVQRHAL